MQVIYSINAKFGGAGIGNTAYHAVLGIHRAHSLAQLFASSDAQRLVPSSQIRQWGILGRVAKYLAAKEPSALLDHLGNGLFDAWVAAQLPRGDVFHGWNGMCLHSLRAAKRRGMITVVERASSHPTTQAELLRQEYARWNVPFVIPTWNRRRMIAEFQACDYITVPSQFVRASMLAHGIPESKLIEIPFGVDSSRFTIEPPASHPFRVIFVGEISLRKGVPYLLDAWQRLNWRDAELWLVGHVASDFAAIRQRWSNVPGIRFLGFSPDPRRLFCESHLFIFPSIEEGSALVTYEAMAAGLPVVTTPNAGSVARDGQEGFIVPIRDVDALADRMQHLRDDEGLRRRMGLAARERVEPFSWERYGERLIEAYHQIAQFRDRRGIG